jgi:hypothetical protein
LYFSISTFSTTALTTYMIDFSPALSDRSSSLRSLRLSF